MRKSIITSLLAFAAIVGLPLHALPTPHRAGEHWTPIHENRFDIENMYLSEYAIFKGVHWLASSRNFSVYGSNGIYSSVDGRNWSRYEFTGVGFRGDSGCMGFAQNDSILIGLFREGVYLTSDGTTWSEVNYFGGSATGLSSIVWSGSQFIIVGTGGRIFTSTDGIAWALQDSGSTENLNDVACIGNEYIVVGENGTILKSSDAINWTPEISNTPNSLISIASSGDRSIVVGQSDILIQFPGTPWIPLADISSFFQEEVIWAGDRFVIVGQASPSTNGLFGTGSVAWSPDGINWKVKHIGGRSISLSGAYWDGSSLKIMGAPEVLLETIDYENWYVIDGYQDRLTEVAYGEFGYVGIGLPDIPSASGNYPVIYRSLDGFNWTAEYSDAQIGCIKLTDVIWNGNQYIAVGQNGTVITSANGRDWILDDSAPSTSFTSVSSDGSSTIACGFDGKIYHLANSSSTWSEVGQLGAGARNPVCIWDGNQYIVLGGDGKISIRLPNYGSIAKSYDGVNWSVETWPSYYNFSPNEIVFNGNVYVVCGLSPFSPEGVWISTDAINWNSAGPSVGYFEKVIWTSTHFLLFSSSGCFTSANGTGWFGPYNSGLVIGGTEIFTGLNSVEGRVIYNGSLATESNVYQVALDAGLEGTDTLLSEDPNQDGFNNAEALSFGISLNHSLSGSDRSRTPQFRFSSNNSIGGVSFGRPHNFPNEITLVIEENYGDLKNESDWMEIARKVGDGYWTGNTEITESIDSNGFTRVTVPNTVTIEDQPRCFTRIRPQFDE